MMALSRGPGNAGTCRPSACAALTPVKSVVCPVPLCGRPSTPSVASTSRTLRPGSVRAQPAISGPPASAASAGSGRREWIPGDVRAETHPVDEDDENGAPSRRRTG